MVAGDLKECHLPRGCCLLKSLAVLGQGFQRGHFHSAQNHNDLFTRGPGSNSESTLTLLTSLLPTDPRMSCYQGL